MNDLAALLLGEIKCWSLLGREQSEKLKKTTKEKEQ